jgi:hypothetical protein
MFTQTAQGHIARCDFIPGRCDSNLRLYPVIVTETNGAQHGTRCGFLNAVSNVAAARFDIDGGSV